MFWGGHLSGLCTISAYRHACEHFTAGPCYSPVRVSGLTWLARCSVELFPLSALGRPSIWLTYYVLHISVLFIALRARLPCVARRHWPCRYIRDLSSPVNFITFLMYVCNAVSLPSLCLAEPASSAGRSNGEGSAALCSEVYFSHSG